MSQRDTDGRDPLAPWRGSVTKFLNLDLELRSSADLTPLERYFQDRGDVCVLGFHREGGECQLTLEPGLDCCNPEAAVAFFRGLLADLPEHLQPLLASCRERDFDFGFEGGLEPFHYAQYLTAAAVRAIASVDGMITVTLYACQLPKGKRKRKRKGKV